MIEDLKPNSDAIELTSLYAAAAVQIANLSGLPIEADMIDMLIDKLLVFQRDLLITNMLEQYVPSNTEASDSDEWELTDE